MKSTRLQFAVVAAFTSGLVACATGGNRIHVPDAFFGNDAGTADAFVPRDAGAGNDAAMAIDAFAGHDAASMNDAFVGHDAASGNDAGRDSGSDAGNDAAVVDAYRGDAGPCATTHLVISEVRSRGAGGAADEFVELFNPTSAAITLDSSWQLSVRSSASTSFTTRWTGTGRTIPPSGHFLIAGTMYTQMPAADEALTTGVTDAGGMQLNHSGTTVDMLCYAYDATTTAALAGYGCEGMPFAMNPHDNSTATNSDASVERLPGGAAGNCTDTDMNSADFQVTMPAMPQDATSPPTP
jgi:hypothetical protein